MKIIKEKSNSNIIIPIEVLKASGLLDSEDIELKTLENAFVLMKGTMNAMELIKLAEGLKSLSEELIVHLAGVCGRCQDCSYCQGLEEFDEIVVPDYLLEEAGIPKDAKLCAYTEEDSGEIIVIQADYDYDIADVPQFVIDIFEMSGICIRELEEKIMREDIVYGD
jgi:bifunctional DNA-binding transcriptional regulator/antitoxin component of YhaV-PrlF toxin-antitoxin module